MKRRTRIAFLAAYLSIGGIVVQLAGCFDIAATTGLASLDVSLLTDAEGRLFGVFNVCGIPDILVVDQNGVPIDILNTEDDLVFNCPISETIVANTGGGGGA